MKSKALQIFIACACGAFIGILAGRQISNSFLSLLVGMLTGGAIGYIIYDAQAIVKAVPRAFRSVNDRHSRLVAWHSMLYAQESALIVPLACVMFAVFPPSQHGHAHVGLLLRFQDWLLSAIWLYMVVSNIIFCGGQLVGRNYSDKKLIKLIAGRRISIKESLGLKRAPGFGKWLLLSNPIVFPFVMIFRLVRGTWHMRSEIANAVFLFFAYAGFCIFLLVSLLPFLWEFAKKVFVLVHSDARVICMVDASIGAGIGILLGHTLFALVAGTVSGGVLGVLNYQVVSLRILKLKPAH